MFHMVGCNCPTGELTCHGAVTRSVVIHVWPAQAYSPTYEELVDDLEFEDAPYWFGADADLDVVKPRCWRHQRWRDHAYQRLFTRRDRAPPMLLC